MIANIVTLNRILFSICLFALPPSSALFGALYLLCGASDVLDGFLARRLHTESRAGELLDSIADLVFAAAYAVKLLPILRIPLWLWACVALIAAVKTVGIIKTSKKARGFRIAHSFANRLTGLLIFILPLTARLIDTRYSAAVVCAVAAFAAAEELFELIKVGAPMQQH